MERDQLQTKIGARIKKSRGDRKAREIARRSKITPVYLCQLEGGSAMPSLLKLYDIARALGTTVQELLP